MGIEYRDYEDKLKEIKKQDRINQIIDEIRECEKVIAERQAYLDNILIHGSDSQNLTEKAIVESILQNPTKNIFTNRIEEEKNKIADLKSEFQKLSS